MSGLNSKTFIFTFCIFTFLLHLDFTYTGMDYDLLQSIIISAISPALILLSAGIIKIENSINSSEKSEVTW